MPDPAPKPSVFHYLDYRTFLQAWFAWKSERRPRYSQRAFARHAGCSHTLVSQILRGERHLSSRTVAGFGLAMALDAREVEHLQLLVDRATATSERARDELTHRALGARGMVGAQDLTRLRHALLSCWWIPVVRELAYSHDFRADPTWIALQLRPAITSDQAAHALEVLTSLDLLHPTPDGGLAPREAPLVTPAEADGATVRSYHRSMIQLACDGLDDCSHDERFYQTAVLAVPQVLQPAVEEELRQLAERLVGMVEHARAEGSPADVQVMLVNLHLLPLSVRRPG